MGSLDHRMASTRCGGVALFISLVILLIVTVLGVSSVNSTSMQERMARNARDSHLAFEAAESALRDAETLMETLVDLSDFTDPGAEGNGFYTRAPCWPTACLGEIDPDAPGFYATVADGDDYRWQRIDWDGEDVIQAGTAIEGVAEPPRYIVEFLVTVISDTDVLNLDNIGQDTGSGRTQLFRATAFGTGGTTGARVMLQTTYGKRF
jgi:type IV pilus assembly protein PilX